MDIKKVLSEATKEIEESSDQLDLQSVKVAYLGKKRKITQLLKSLKDLSLDEKKSTGAELNQLRSEVDNLIKSKFNHCLLYTSPSPRDKRQSRMPSSA